LLVLLRGEVVLLVGSVCFSDRFGVTELYIFSTVLFIYRETYRVLSKLFFSLYLSLFFFRCIAVLV